MSLSSSTNGRQPYRWIILLSRSVVCFFTLGIFKSFGIFLPYFMTYFSVSSMSVGVVSCISFAGGLILIGPFAGALLKVCSPRILTMAGGFLAGLSMLAASFAVSWNQVAASLVISGTGTSFCFVISVKPLMEYFPDDFAFANGISLAGGTIGMMVMPPVIEYLVSVYGWRQVLTLIGALLSNYVVCGALLRPLNKALLPAQYNLVPLQPNAGVTASKSGGGVTDGRQPNQGEKPGKFNIEQILNSVRKNFDTHILVEPLFVIMSLISTLEGLLFTMWHLYIIPQGVELGFGESPSAFLATFGGAGSLLGRITHGSAIDRDLIKAPNLFIISSLVFAASNIIDPLVVTSYFAIATTTFISGLAFGVIYPLVYVLMREVTGDRHLSAYGWLFLTIGTGEVLGGALAGWIHDLSGDYRWVFLSVGVLSVTMAALTASMRLMVHCYGVGK